MDQAAQTKILLSSILKARGSRGVTKEDALQVILWARGVHEEAAEIATLKTRVRKAKAENLPERQANNDLNKTLLNSVLAGSLYIDVNEAGMVIFGQVAS